jgi:adenylate cyclase
MSPQASTDSHLEIAHVLFIDIVAYSKLPVNQQAELIKQLNEQVRNTEEFRAADAAGKLIRLATGDGMALAFFTSPDAPLRCALQLSEALRESPRLQLRMGIHSGPVEKLADVNERSNVAGDGLCRRWSHSALATSGR